MGFALVEQLILVPWMVVVTAVLYRLSRLPAVFWLERVHYPGLFLLAVVVLLPWVSGETILWQMGGLSLRQEGLLLVILIASRFFSILTVGLVLFGTMPFLTTVKALKSLGLPALLADMLLLTYRYLFEIGARLAQMQSAMKLRGFRSQPRPWFSPRDISRLGALVGTLLIRSYDQAEQIYQALRLRGYGQARRSPVYSTFPPLWHGLGVVISWLVALSFPVMEMLY